MRELDVINEILAEASAMLLAEGARADGPRGAGSKMPVDDEIETLFKARLWDAFPDDEVYAEEQEARPGRSGRAWVIDPHDGTSDFLIGRRETSISVALVEDDRFLMAAVCAPYPHPLLGPAGLAVTWALGEPLRVNGAPYTPPPAPDDFDDPGMLALVSARISEEKFARDEALFHPARVARCSSVATRWMLVAAGRADVGLTILNALAPWDFAGGQALLQAVGGALVDHEGHPIAWSKNRPLLSPRRGYFGARSLALAQAAARRYAHLTG